MPVETVRDIDRGWKEIKRKLSIRKAYTKVGLPQDGEVAPPKSIRTDQVPVSDMSDLVMVGAANEFGTKRIPARSFLRSATDKATTTIFKLKAKMIDDILQGKRTVREGLSVLGEYLTGQVRKKIVSIRTPPNAPSTLARKFPKTNPLIDKGQLVQSIQHEETVL